MKKISVLFLTIIFSIIGICAYAEGETQTEIAFDNIEDAANLLNGENLTNAIKNFSDVSEDEIGNDIENDISNLISENFDGEEMLSSLTTKVLNESSNFDFQDIIDNIMSAIEEFFKSFVDSLISYIKTSLESI